MGDVAIRIEGLSKRYRIGTALPRYGRLTESLWNAARAPFRRLRGGPPAYRTGGGCIWALKDVTLNVRGGDVVGFIGRNGAGKTTLLKVLSRITEPTEGFAEINGRVGSLLEVGTGFHPELTGRENTYLSGAVLGMSNRQIRRRFDEMVSFAGVETFVDTPLKHYSTGMQVRLAFAVAAHMETDILLVDEVLAVGDLEFQERCLGKMGEISRQGRTVLFVSHNLQSLQSLCGRGILLEKGRVALDDSIGTVVARYVALVRETAGEVSWPSPEEAPGDGEVRIRAVRVVSQGRPTAEVEIDKPFRIQVDYWILRDGIQRPINFNLFNGLGVMVLSSFNTPSASLEPPDEWSGKLLPARLFRTACEIPALLLNDGPHIVDIGIHKGTMSSNAAFYLPEALTFFVRDTGVMRREYKGHWLGAVRPRLRWSSVILEEEMKATQSQQSGIIEERA